MSVRQSSVCAPRRAKGTAPHASRGALAGLAVALAVVVAAGCGRKEALLGRLRAIPDEYAHQVVADAVWAHGSLFKWAAHESLRMEVTWTEHRPTGDVASDEVWLLDLDSGHFRIEKPAANRVTLYDGWAWRSIVDGRETDDLELRGEAAGQALMLRVLAPMPFYLLGPGLKIAYVGTRTGPGETHTWNRLLVTHGASSGIDPLDRTLVEIDRDSHLVSAVLGSWGEPPFLGAYWRVDMDEWWPVGGVLMSHRWRFTPITDAGAPTGRVRWTLAVRNVVFGVWIGPGAYSRP